MSVFTPTKHYQPKVHHSQYIRTANTPDESDTKPANPVAPVPKQPDAE